MGASRRADGGSLIVTGTGIAASWHLTMATIGHLLSAQTVLLLLPDRPVTRWVAEQNPSAESLDRVTALPAAPHVH